MIGHHSIEGGGRFETNVNTPQQKFTRRQWWENQILDAQLMFIFPDQILQSTGKILAGTLAFLFKISCTCTKNRFIF